MTYFRASPGSYTFGVDRQLDGIKKIVIDQTAATTPAELQVGRFRRILELVAVGLPAPLVRSMRASRKENHEEGPAGARTSALVCTVIACFDR